MTSYHPPLDQFDLSALHPQQAKLLSDALKKSGLYDLTGNTLSPSGTYAFTTPERREAVVAALTFLANKQYEVEIGLEVFVDAKHLTLCTMVMLDLLEALAWKTERTYHDARMEKLERMAAELEAVVREWHAWDLSSSRLFTLLEPAVRGTLVAEYGRGMAGVYLHVPRNGFLPEDLADDLGVLMRFLVHVARLDAGSLRP